MWQTGNTSRYCNYIKTIIMTKPFQLNGGLHLQKDFLKFRPQLAWPGLACASLDIVDTFLFHHISNDWGLKIYISIATALSRIKRYIDSLISWKRCRQVVYYFTDLLTFRPTLTKNCFFHFPSILIFSSLLLNLIFHWVVVQLFLHFWTIYAHLFFGSQRIDYQRLPNHLPTTSILLSLIPQEANSAAFSFDLL